MNAFYDRAYRWVNNEEGGYEAFCGYNVFVRNQDCDGYTFTWVYTAGGNGANVFETEDAARDFVSYVSREDYNLNDKFWECIEQSHPDDFPDYVINPHRPEYN